jgi:hypothetical protein
MLRVPQQRSVYHTRDGDSALPRAIPLCALSASARQSLFFANPSRPTRLTLRAGCPQSAQGHAG